jgi:hypothetical protein
LYSAFGLSLAANWSIPGLIPRAILSRADLSVLRHEQPTFADDEAGEQLYYVSDEAEAGVPALQVWEAADGASFRLRYADATEFLVARTGREIRVIIPAASTPEDTATYLLGPILGFAMRLRGITCLHASVVAVGGSAIAIAGPAGAGKSTAAACFAAMGIPVLADDIAALVEDDGTVNAQPAYPQLRLWPDSVAMLYGTPDALPRLTPTWDKRALLLSEPGAFGQRSLPLRAVYVLGEQRDHPQTAIEDVSGAQRLLALLSNTYVGYLLDAAMRRQEFESLVRLATAVPVRRLLRPSGSRDVAALCARLLEDCERLRCTALPTMAP